MTLKRLDYKQMSTAYIGASVAAVTAGTVSAGLWDRLGGQSDYLLFIGGAWLVTVGLPSLVVASETLLKTLGKRSPITIRRSGQYPGRKVPINYSGGRQSHVFLSALPLIGQKPVTDSTFDQPESVALPQQFTVTIEGNPYTVSLNDMRDFLYVAWRRQRAGYNGLSRKYWCKDRRPTISKLEYSVRLHILLAVDGLIVDRGERRSGRLSVPPQMATKAIQAEF